MFNPEITAEYRTITASADLRKRIHQIKKTDRTNRVFFRTIISVAAVFALMIGVFNANPAFVYAVQDVPVLNQVVKIITLYRYEVKDNGYEADVTVPKIEGLLDAELRARINADFKEHADAVLLAFENDVAAQQAVFGDDPGHLSITSDYVIKTDTDRILSIDSFLYSAVGSSATVHRFYTIDKETEELLSLSALFKPNADFITPISDYIAAEMARINEEDGGTFDAFARIGPDQNFYINSNGALVICFDEYEVAAGVQGSPEFVIPLSVIAQVTDSDLLTE